MRLLEFSVEIRAPRQRVWEVLWNNETFRQWASVIDTGTYMVGELKQGSEVQFLSAGGYGVTSLVEKLVPNELLVLRHQADTKDSGKNTRDKQWTGGMESYQLVENSGKTKLTISFNAPEELEQMMQQRYPMALDKIKEIAEQ